MKIAVRIVALAFLVTGFVASSHSQQSSQPGRRTAVAASPQVISSFMPAPACPPDDPDACGIDSKTKPK